MTEKSYRRLPASVRRQQIQEAALEMIYAHGLLGLSMQRVIDHSGLSKGGVYHYYQNLPEIVDDLLKASLTLRYQKIKEGVERYGHLSRHDLLVELSLDKAFDDAPHKRLFTMVMQAKDSHPGYLALYERFLEAAVADFDRLVDAVGLPELKSLNNPGFNAFLTSMIYSSSVLGFGEIFRQSRPMFRLMLSAYFDTLWKEETP